jgi:surface antigen Omp85-like protein/calcineurin-like phosphoesterase family protein
MNRRALIFSIVVYNLLLVAGFNVNGIELSGVDSTKANYSIYFIGDVGDDTTLSEPVLSLLRSQILNEGFDSSMVVFLGDNIYPKGLHKKSSKYRPQDESRINIQLDALKNYQGEIIFLSGNHDWKKGGEKGDNYVRRQERYIESYLDRGNVFLPDGGCPGPVVTELDGNLVLIVLDTQWWLHPYDKPRGEQDGCDVLDKGEMIIRFADLLKKYRNKNVVIAAHHPLFSNGIHGGKFPLKTHIFPFTEINPAFYLPLPVIGSIYPLYRQMLGNIQDLAHPVYQSMIDELNNIIDDYDNVIYVAGHDHSLQYLADKNNHHIISGAGSKVTYLKNNRDLIFGAEKKGFSKVSFLSNGEVWLEFYSPEKSGDNLLYKQLLYQRIFEKEKTPVVNKISYAGKVHAVTADSGYMATNFKKKIFGSLNREIWTTEIEVPYLDLHYEKGGLSPIKKGGGMQTISLRLQGANGHQYVIRKIKKDATYLVDRELRNTLAQDIILDGIAASNPYSPVTVPVLSDAVGVYHTNPELVYVPADSVLGKYADEFGGSFCLFEERPNDDMSDFKSFGRSKKVVSYSKAIDKIHGKYSHVVDVDYVVRARLLDMFLADWDRHDDQWRWATFKIDDKTIYRPIPRDRDQVYFIFNGLLPKLTNRRWAQNKFQSFRDDIRDIEGQNFNGRYFDRTFLVEADREKWLNIADSMKLMLSDDVINEAINKYPPQAFDKNGQFIISTLKARRDNLDGFAARYYKVLSKEVDVVGTTKNDFFEVVRLNDEEVEVNVYPRKNGKKQADKRYYHRVFERDQTKEIRLYGIGGDDEYKIKGEVNKSILVRIIGGFDNDKYEDESVVKGLKKHTKIYDVKEGHKNKIQTTSETRVYLMNEEDAYSYNRKDFKYDKLMPIPSVGFTPDDGFFIGGGFSMINHGFKKNPYKSTHNFLANIAFKTGAYRIKYIFEYTEVIGKWNFAGAVNIDQPLIFDFYGLGNETDAPFNENEPAVRQNNVRINPFVRYVSKNRAHNILIGAITQFVSFDQSDNANQLFPELLKTRKIGGLNWKYIYVNKDNKVNPHRGVRFDFGSEWNHSLVDESIDFQKIESQLAIYLPVRFMPITTTLGLRTGGAKNFGDYEFYQANFLGGYKQFRGVTRNRFAGESSYYNNIDLRIDLASIPNYVLPFEMGALVHYDIARVWIDDENSKLWHNSYGAGLYINILDFFILNGTYSISDVDKVFVVRGNFLF